MKTLLTIILLSLGLTSYAQLPATRQNAALLREERYVTNSPGNGIGTSRRIEYTKDSTFYVNESIVFGLSNYGGSRNDSSPSNFLWTDVNGYVKRSTLPSWLTQAQSDLLYYPLAGNPSGFLTSVPAQTFSSLTGKPTTLPGYGIVDGVPISRTLTINGVTFDLSANRTWTFKRQETYAGTTNASGLYTVAYGTAYSTTPNVQFQIGTGGNNKETILLTSSTTTGFTCYVQLRTDVLGLLPSYSNVSGRNVSVLVTES